MLLSQHALQPLVYNFIYLIIHGAMLTSWVLLRMYHFYHVEDKRMEKLPTIHQFVVVSMKNYDY